MYLYPWEVTSYKPSFVSYPFQIYRFLQLFYQKILRNNQVNNLELNRHVWQHREANTEQNLHNHGDTQKKKTHSIIGEKNRIVGTSGLD